MRMLALSCISVLLVTAAQAAEPQRPTPRPDHLIADRLAACDLPRVCPKGQDE